ncbi:GNAT family N-acetyltransferase [Agromyces seonyuensis]|uniref:GNAT family N-acetyltransferase n=1 Tax=Agromyces seonyuensis TaxID=2662446 RepID=A0A6I4NUZ4_9MICO|nr:GNAT family N-acetyltransferase [Agromyces seonyuensis]MWB97911.1 GNAT family N-acetyltransferase [Agromyces seonyuensis]
MSLPWEFHPLAGERVRLELLRPDDLDELARMQGDPEICRYLLYEARTREQVVDVLATDSAAVRLAGKGDYVQPAIRGAEGEFLGTMYLELTSVDDRTAELGWILLPEAQGRGFAAESARLLLRLAFEEIGLHRVVAELDPRNGASVRLCERLGMRKEAHILEHMFLKGEWTDTGSYAILEREWQG